jgi:5-hydroxyisourate hydrolase-like protein (transthyretin family)
VLKTKNRISMYRLYNGINATELEPSEFSLGQNYPNPFKNKTVIKYCVAYKTKVQIIICNSEGKLIEKLVDEEKKPGTYEVEFNTSIDFFGKSSYLLNGDYFYRMIAGDYSSEIKWFCINN